MGRVNQSAVVLGFAIASGSIAMAMAPPSSPAPKAEQGMSMGDMMKKCREHCDATRTHATRTSSAMDEAKRSGEPARMRSAMEDAQKALGEMTEHMDGCMRMMDTMGHKGMHGEMGMPSGSSTPMASPPGAQASPAPKDSALYSCPMHPEVTSGRPGTCPRCGMALRAR